MAISFQLLQLASHTEYGNNKQMECFYAILLDHTLCFSYKCFENLVKILCLVELASCTISYCFHAKRGIILNLPNPSSFQAISKQNCGARAFLDYRQKKRFIQRLTLFFNAFTCCVYQSCIPLFTLANGKQSTKNGKKKLRRNHK